MKRCWAGRPRRPTTLYVGNLSSPTDERPSRRLKADARADARAHETAPIGMHTAYSMYYYVLRVGSAALDRAARQTAPLTDNSCSPRRSGVRFRLCLCLVSCFSASRVKQNRGHAPGTLFRCATPHRARQPSPAESRALRLLAIDSPSSRLLRTCAVQRYTDVYNSSC